jgi:hypothetical protein
VIISRVDTQLNQIQAAAVPFINAGSVAPSEVLREAVNAKDSATEIAAELESILDKIRKESAQTGVQRLSGHYEAQANHHEAQARRFLYGAVAVLVVTLALGLVLLSQPIGTPDPATALVDYLRALTPRVFLIGLGVYAGRFTLRQYTVNKHQKVVNEQRRNALDTFSLIVASVGETTTRDLVVVEMVKSVFRGVDTGYVDAKGATTVLEDPAAAITALLTRQQP